MKDRANEGDRLTCADAKAVTAKRVNVADELLESLTEGLAILRGETPPIWPLPGWAEPWWLT